MHVNDLTELKKKKSSHMDNSCPYWLIFVKLEDNK